MTVPFDPSKLSELDDIDVLRLPYLAVAEARRRGLVTTWDLPSGGYAEALALAVFGGTAWGAAGIGHDLTDPVGRRVEVKAVAAGHSTSPAHPANFDALCLVRLEPENLDVRYAVLMPTDVAVELGRPHARGGISVRATKGLPQRSGVEDLTDVFRAAAARACPDCGASFTTDSPETAEPLLEVVRAHQRIWHGSGTEVL
jgi:hypothetical protein